MVTISVLNLKGGVGKTHVAANMAYELHRRGYKVLMIDNDKQGNLSRTYNRYSALDIAPITKMLSLQYGMDEGLIQETAYEWLDIITSNMSLFGATWNLTKEEGVKQIERYKDFMEWTGIDEVYDYCIIDNPPDVGMNVVNALAITDEVIVPVKIDEDALEGLDIVADQTGQAKAFNEKIKLAGVLVTSYQNTDGEAAGLEWLKTNSAYKVLGVIRYSKKVAESSFMRKPIYEYSPCCAAAQDYKRFVTAYTGKVR